MIIKDDIKQDVGVSTTTGQWDRTVRSGVYGARRGAARQTCLVLEFYMGWRQQLASYLLVRQRNPITR